MQNLNDARHIHTHPYYCCHHHMKLILFLLWREFSFEPLHVLVVPNVSVVFFSPFLCLSKVRDTRRNSEIRLKITFWEIHPTVWKMLNPTGSFQTLRHSLGWELHPSKTMFCSQGWLIPPKNKCNENSPSCSQTFPKHDSTWSMCLTLFCFFRLALKELVWGQPYKILM